MIWKRCVDVCQVFVPFLVRKDVLAVSFDQIAGAFLISASRHGVDMQDHIQLFAVGVLIVFRFLVHGLGE